MKQETKPVNIDLNAATADLRKRWPWVSGSVESATATNLLQYLKPVERIHFVNELYRVLHIGGKAQIVTPHWSSNRAYGDLAFEWPPIVENWYFHLNKEWRTANNTKEKRYKCDFDTTWGYGLHPMIVSRNMEYQQHAVSFWKEAAQDLCATLTKK